MYMPMHVLALMLNINPCRGRARKERERNKERNQARAALRKAKKKVGKAARTGSEDQVITVSAWAAIGRGSGPT